MRFHWFSRSHWICTFVFVFVLRAFSVCGSFTRICVRCSMYCNRKYLVDLFVCILYHGWLVVILAYMHMRVRVYVRILHSYYFYFTAKQCGCILNQQRAFSCAIVICHFSEYRLSFVVVVVVVVRAIVASDKRYQYRRVVNFWLCTETIGHFPLHTYIRIRPAHNSSVCADQKLGL